MSDSDNSEDDVIEFPTDRDLGSIISYLVNSGQMRLVRFGGLGGFEASFDNTDFERRNLRLPSPTGDPNPDTSNIDKSELKNMLLNSKGAYLAEPRNITKRIMQRQSGLLCKRNNFKLADFTLCYKNFLPNTFKTVVRYHGKVFSGSYSSDGSMFMSACQDQRIRLYDTTKGNFKLFRDIAAKSVGWNIVDTAYSPDQMHIIYSSWCSNIHLCSIYGDHGTHMALDLRPSDTSFCAFSISFSQDSKEIIAGGSDHRLYIFDREKNERIMRIIAHSDDVNSVKFADCSSNILISGADDGMCKVWDRRTLSKQHPKPVGVFAGHVHGITYICPKGDGIYFLSNSKDQSIKLWDIRRFSSQDTIRLQNILGRLRKEHRKPRFQGVVFFNRVGFIGFGVSTEFSEAENLIANQTWDYQFSYAPRRSNRLNKSPGNDAVMTYRGHLVRQTLLRAKFSPSYSTGQQYIYTACASGSVVIYDVLSGNIVTKLKGAHTRCVRDVSWHPYENTIISSSWDCSLGKWDYRRTVQADG